MIIKEINKLKDHYKLDNSEFVEVEELLLLSDSSSSFINTSKLPLFISIIKGLSTFYTVDDKFDF